VSQVNYVKYANKASQPRDLTKGRSQRYRCMLCRGSMSSEEAMEFRPGVWGHKKHKTT
jgi:hypothetical protein